MFSVQNNTLFGELEYARQATENMFAKLDSQYFNYGNVSHDLYFINVRENRRGNQEWKSRETGNTRQRAKINKSQSKPVNVVLDKCA